MPEYTQGHAAPVLKVHGKRTLQNTSSALLPYLHPTDVILDIGCGPGSISCDLAQAVPQGRVIAVDYASSVLEVGRQLAQARGVQNIVFEQADVYELEAKYGEGVFDVVHVHQVLIHLAEPVRALTEMRKVVKEGGVVSVREGDFGTMVTSPLPGAIHSWDIFQKVMRASGAEPNAGRHLAAWAVAAGYTRAEIDTSAGIELTNGEADVREYGLSHADRIMVPQADRMVELGFVTQEEKEQMAQEWRVWAERGKEGAVNFIGHVQIICGRRVVERRAAGAA